MDIATLPLISGICALIFVGFLVLRVMKESHGTEKMKEISLAIRKGAMAFLRREFLT